VLAASKSGKSIPPLLAPMFVGEGSVALTLIAEAKMETPATSLSESVFVTPATLRAAAQTQAQHVL
jgi:hypothetical protein